MNEDDQELNDAVTNALLSRLTGETRVLADGLEPLDIGSAIHAVSRLVFNEMSAPASVMAIFHRDGWVNPLPGYNVITPEAVELEIARACGFVRGDVSDEEFLSVLNRARLLRQFVFQAAIECPQLFEHLRGQVPAAEGHASFTIIPARERILDAAKRWRA